MKFLEAAKMVVESKTAHLIRPRKGADMEYDAKPIFTGSKRGWVMLDTFTASAVTAVANVVSESTRELMNSMKPSVVADVAFKNLQTAY